MSQVLHPEIQSAFTGLLRQLLQDKSQSTDLGEIAEWISQLLKNKRIYNAYYDLAEEIYDASAFQCEQLPYFHQTQLYHILQQGRQAIYLPCQNGLSSFDEQCDSEMVAVENHAHLESSPSEQDTKNANDFNSMTDTQFGMIPPYPSSADATSVDIVKW